MVHSAWINRDVGAPTAAAFCRAAASVIGSKAVRNLLWHGRLSAAPRTAETTAAEYDRKRSQIVIGSFDDFLIGHAADDFILKDGRLTFGAVSISAETDLPLLLDLVRKHAGSGPIVEIGSGDGRNLMWLRKQGITNRLVGLELSPASVDVAKRASETFAAPVEFYAADCTKPLPDVVTVPAGLVLSFHAFEMMPRIFTGALDNIRALQPNVAAFFEPVEELWPWDIRGAISRLRVRQLDRLRGFMPQIRARFDVMEARALTSTGNPLNQTCLVVARPR
jgi:hypothetical protein